MKHIIAFNGSPCSGWNTDILVREAAAGAAYADAVIEVIDLYKLNIFTCCVSCFGCKTKKYLGTSWNPAATMSVGFPCSSY